MAQAIAMAPSTVPPTAPMTATATALPGCHSASTFEGLALTTAAEWTGTAATGDADEEESDEEYMVCQTTPSRVIKPRLNQKTRFNQKNQLIHEGKKPT